MTWCGKEDVRHTGPGDGTREHSCQYPTTYQLLEHIPAHHKVQCVPGIVEYEGDWHTAAVQPQWTCRLA